MPCAHYELRVCRAMSDEEPATEHKSKGTPSELRPEQHLHRSSSECARLLNLGNLKNRDLMQMFNDLDKDNDGARLRALAVFTCLNVSPACMR